MRFYCSLYFSRTFPYCKFGEKCLYIHPNCKYDAKCTRMDCPFTHATRRAGGFTPTVIHQCKFFYFSLIYTIGICQKNIPTLQIFSEKWVYFQGKQLCHFQFYLPSFCHFQFYLPSQWVSALNPIALRKAKIAHNFGLSECKRVKDKNSFL